MLARRPLLGSLGIALVLGSGAVTRGAPPAGGEGTTRIIVDGRIIVSDTPPRRIAGTLLVPLRVVGEALGGRVSWDAAGQRATVRADGRALTARVGERVLRSNNRTFTAGAAPRMVDGRVMVPLRAVGEALGAAVTWDAAGRTLSIRTARGPTVAARDGQAVPEDRAVKNAAETTLRLTLRTDKTEYAAGEPVELTLEARNASTSPITLHLTSGQRYDFEVRRGDTLIWKWSDDRMFTQALAEVAIAPGQSVVFRDTWPQRDRQGRPVAPGEYVVTGYLADRTLTVPRPSVTVRLLPAKG